MDAAPFVCRSKIWIQDQKGEVVFGLGRYRILETVRRTGSLNATAKELKMSYRSVWMRIRASEERMGKTLLIRDSKGSRLTPFAERLMAQFESFQSRIKDQSDAFYESLISESINDVDQPS